MRRCFQVMFAAMLAAMLLSIGTVRAAEPASETPPLPTVSKSDAGDLTYAPQWPEPPNTGAMLMRLGFGTAFVLVLCVGSLWFGKPWLMKLQTKGLTGQALQIEGSVTLGGRAVLYLVKVGDTQLVAGTDATGLKSLIALPPSFREALDEQLPVEEAPPAITASSFETRLRSAASLQGGSL